MKTKEVIKRLQKADPSGELECCVEGEDIYDIDNWPAYYDGRLQVLIRDPNIKEYYNVMGAKYVSTGNKIVITPLSIEDAIFEDPEIPVEIPDGDTYHKNKVEKYRKESRKLNKECDKIRLLNEKEQKH